MGAVAAGNWPAVLHTPDFKQKVQNAKVLCVGAGGIGCELLKTLVASGFKNIEVIDLDTIETSNLNRQFLFRKQHVGQSKAEVAAQVIKNIKPDAEITAYHGNVKESRFGIDFFKRFDVVLNGLDNLEARRHVNRLCLAANKPLVESGTAGYLGQVTIHLKSETECFECQPKPVQKSYPICTLRNTPDKPIHCIVWGKELLFPRLFGDPTQTTDLDEQQAEGGTEAVNGDNADGEGEGAAGKEGEGEGEEAGEKEDLGFYLRGEGEAPLEYAVRVFRRLYHDDIQRLIKMEDLWKTRRPPTPLDLDQILPDTSDLGPSSSVAAATSASRALGLRNHHEVWSLQDNARVFIKSIAMYLDQRKEVVGTSAASFDKDDDLAVDFVTAAANLRAACYGIPQQTVFNAKGMAGNIIHAIATTNAIVSGLLVVQALKILAGIPHSELRNTFLHKDVNVRQARGQTIRELITTEACPCPNPSCMVCGRAQLHLTINTATTKFSTFIDKVLKKRLATVQPYLMCGSFDYTVEEEDDEGERAAKEALLGRPLAELPGGGIVNGSVLEVGDDMQEFVVQLLVQHQDEFDEEEVPEGFVLSGKVPVAAPSAGPSSSTDANGAGPSGSAGAGPSSSKAAAVQEDEDGVLLIDDDEEEEAAAAARDPKGKRPAVEAGEGAPPGKRSRVEVVEDDDDVIVLD